MYDDEYNNYSTSLNSYVNSNVSIQLSQIPSLITNTFQNIESCDSKITSALEDAKDAQDDARYAYNKDHGLFSGKGDTLDALQTAAKTLAKAQSTTVDGLKMCFDNQKAMAQSIQYLFALGCVNMAANRTVVREIQMKLQNASREQLSELAKQELQNVILQLKAQENLYNRIEKHSEALRSHDNLISSIKSDLNSGLSGVNSKLTAMSSRLETDNRSINELQNQINILNNSCENLNTVIKQIEAKIQSLNEFIQTTKSDNKKEIEKLGNSLKSDFEKYISTIKGQINAFEKAINDTETRLRKLMNEQEAKAKDLEKKTTESIDNITQNQEKKIKEVESTFQQKMNDLANNNQILARLNKIESRLEKNEKTGHLQICTFIISLLALISSCFIMVKMFLQ
ncbi:MAG: hypothetical protein MJZ23_02465 [Paludibacteraceae bacterium]|nr:hypothetical protein [Paludibacteraceae bacterium]